MRDPEPVYTAVFCFLGALWLWLEAEPVAFVPFLFGLGFLCHYFTTKAN